jgi:TonB family protein
VFFGALLVSAGLHLAVGPPLRDAIEKYLAGARLGARPPVKVVRLTAEQWSQNMRTRPGQKPPPPSASKPLVEAQNAAPKEAVPPAPEPPKPEEPQKVDGQIVEVPPTADDSPNAKAKYLSKYNTHVEKESIARPEERNHKLKRVTNKLQTTGSEDVPREAAVVTPNLSAKGDGLEQDRTGKPEEEKMVLKVPDILRREEINLKLGGSGDSLRNRSRSEELRGNSDHFELKLGSAAEESSGEAGGTKGSLNGSEKRSLPTVSALMPNLGTLSQLSGSPSPDHVEGVPEGEATFLNTKEFKYATFFYRVRDSVFDHWVDAATREYRRRDPTGNIYGVRDRATMLAIQLGKSGELDDIRVEKTSGVEFLDMVAVEAFRRAQPFPNPPPGIVDDDGRIRFNFQFIITMSSSRGLNLFRRY